MKHYLKALMFLCITVLVTNGERKTVAINEQWVCSIKKTCFDCLRLPHCSWCETENTCYSDKIEKYSEFCKDNTVVHKDFGFSIDENARCRCSKEDFEKPCLPLDAEGRECSGRGTCVCGRCVCNPEISPDSPTKVVMGEFCEFDNYSCDGPKCNEGPYSISQPQIAEEESNTTVIEQHE